MAPRLCSSSNSIPNSKGKSTVHSKAQRAKDGFYWSSEYKNSLPEVPFNNKFIPCPFVPLSRFINYKETSLEATFKSKNLCDFNMGINVNIIEPDFYKKNPKAEIHPSDQKLLEDESASAIQKLKRSAQHAKPVPFMRKTEYISSEFNRFGKGADRQETKVGFKLMKTVNPEDLVYRSRDSQIEAIQKTFEDVNKKVKKHHSKKGVTAVEEVFILPDFKLWKHSFSQVLFDADPSYNGVPENLRKIAMENGIISGLEGNEVGYFCPKKETIKKFEEDKKSGRSFNPEETYEFGLNREYTWEVRNKRSKNFEDDFVLYRKGNHFLYDELETRVKLSRKRRPAGVQKRKVEMQVNYRDENEKEMELGAKRMKLLSNEEEE